jgi:formate hydrogenlyase transcriptional activator
MESTPLDGQATAIGDRYRALLVVSEAIVSHRDLSALFRALAGRLQQVAHFDYLGLHLHEAESGTMHLHVLEPLALAVLVSGLRFPVEESPAGVVW